MLPEPTRTILGRDPAHRQNVLNGCAYQQDAIATCHGWQYACFYASRGPAREPLYVHLARRQLPDGPWDTFVFDDYPQTTDDGHNTVQLGVCPGDGTIHLSYDHHCDRINYRHSVRGLATTPAAFAWSAAHFTSTLHHLPGLEADAAAADLLGSITYPRLGPFPASGDLWLSFRTGKAGLGDDHLCVYGRPDNDDANADAATTTTEGRQQQQQQQRSWRLLGTPLRGVRNNPYVHGLTPTRAGGLYATWVYRGFVPYPGWDDPRDTQHKQQAGPNSAAENYDLCFAWSPDEGRTWRNGAGAPLAVLARGEAVGPDSPSITAFRIPRASGLTNQEAQAVDADGGVHVLNRDALGTHGGPARWKHYHRTPGPAGVWSARPLPLVPPVGVGGRRGRLAVSRGGDYLYFVLPAPDAPELSVWRAARAAGFAEYELVWGGRGFPGAEPLVDAYRLEHDGVLSVFTRAEGVEGVDVVVLDFQLGE